MNAMQRWMSAATPDEKDRLAALAKTSRGQLYQLAGGHRYCSAQSARLIELAAAKLRAKNPNLPPLLRTDLCAACAACEFAKQCKK